MQPKRADRSTRILPPRGEVTGIVLCGGASSRMGRDKACIELDGSTLLESAVRSLEPVAGQVLLACGAEPRYTELNHPVVLDDVAGGGPLAGLAAGLDAAATEWSFAVACDMPRLDPDLLEALLERALVEDLDLCLTASGRGLEPLCAVYRRSCLAPVRAALAAGERRMVSFWRGPWAEQRPPLRAGTLDLEGRASAGDPTVNLNSPDDLEQERRHRAGLKS